MVFHSLYTFIDHRNDIKMLKTLKWNHMLVTRDSTSIVSLYVYVTLTKTRPGPGEVG